MSTAETHITTGAPASNPKPGRDQNDTASTTDPGAGGSGATGAPPPGGGVGESSEGRPDGATDAPSNSPLFDQSYTWMLQLVMLLAVMTLFFPFMRKVFGVKPQKRQTVSYSTYDSDDEDCEEDDDFCREE